MPSLNETKNSIESITSTQKITRAMYLMSASKSKKARSIYEQCLPYFKQVAVTLSEILSETEPFKTPYLNGYGGQENAGNLVLILSADKGLSGGYLNNIITLLERTVDKEKDTCWVAGVTGYHKITAKGFPVSRHFRYPIVNPDLYMTREVGDKLIAEFKTGRYKSVRMVFSMMILSAGRSGRSEKSVGVNSMSGHISDGL